jgi:quercetin dioxygenase-like cupin family protein
MDDRSKVIKYLNGGWDGVAVRDYKENDRLHRSVTRRDLLGAAQDEHGLSVITRYFEVAPGGYSTLERHEHAHAVIVLHGQGTAILGEHSYAIAPFDCVYVARDTLHQFQASEDAALGFLCIVDRVRDRPRLPSPDELKRLAALGVSPKPGVAEKP